MPPTASAPAARRHGRVPRLLALGLALSGALSACSGDDDAPSGPSEVTPSAPPPLTTTASLGVVTGKVRPRERDRAVSNVTTVVDGWLDAAYVAGDYPRDSFPQAFAGFTPDAAELAARDARLMSNADIGRRIDSVRAVGRRVVVDLLGAGGLARAATARIRLVFVTAGDLERRVTVIGRLGLVRNGAAWRVFSYDVGKSDQPVGASPSADESGATQ